MLLAMRKINPHWIPRCPSCGSYEVDYAPFTDGKEWDCQDCAMYFNQGEQDEDDVACHLSIIRSHVQDAAD